MAKSSAVTTVDRLVSVLDCFSADRPVWSLADLSAHLDLPKSTLHRFLISLEVHGILRRDPDDRLWRPGYRLVTWGALAERATGLSDVARPIMRRLAAHTGEMVALTVYDEREVVCIDKVETRHSVRVTLEVGERRPAHAGASSKILMAYLAPAERQAIIHERGLPQLCPNTITGPEQLEAELVQIRHQGYALSIEETDPGAWGIATPVWDRHGTVIAALGIAGPIQRYSEALSSSYVALCREACQELSHQLGAPISAP
jgi:IclR family transcriptional regulator, KDG regulon repressor